MSRILDTIRPRRLEIALAVLLVAATAATFASVVGLEFVAWDDDIEITRNTNIRALGLENLRWMFTDVGSTLRYVPLSWLTWSIVYAAAGLDPRAFHLLNLLLHLANVVLVFALIRALLDPTAGAHGEAPAHGETGALGEGEVPARARAVFLRPRPGPAPRAAIALIAALAALLWAVHPLRTEVVAWATHARYAQSFLFFIVALLFYLRSVRRTLRSARRSPAPALGDPAYWMAVAAGAASALSYATGIVLPAILIVLDAYPLRRLRSPGPRGRVLLEKAPFLLAPALVGAVTLWGRMNARGIWEAPASFEAFGPLARTMQALYVWAYYVWRPFVPLGLSPVYTRLVHFDPLTAPFLASAVVVAGLTALSLALRNRLPALLALWVCHLAVLVPVLGLTEHPHYASDRYAYLQGVVWSVAAAAALWVFAVRRPRALAAAASVLLALSIGLACLAHRQTRIWKDSITLFESMISRLGNDPYTEDLYWRLGFERIKRGKGDDDEIGAALLMRHAAPARALEGAGRILLERQTYEAAAGLLARAASQGGGASAHTALGVALLRMKRAEGAAAALARAVELDPANLIALEYLGIAHMAEGKFDEAIAELEEVVRRDPRNEGARRRLDAARAARGAGAALPPVAPNDPSGSP